MSRIGFLGLEFGNGVELILKSSLGMRTIAIGSTILALFFRIFVLAVCRGWVLSFGSVFGARSMNI